MEPDHRGQVRRKAQHPAHYHMQIKVEKVDVIREGQYAVPCTVHGVVVRAFRGPLVPAKSVSFAHTCILDGSLLPVSPDTSFLDYEKLIA